MRSGLAVAVFIMSFSGFLYAQGSPEIGKSPEPVAGSTIGSSCSAPKVFGLGYGGYDRYAMPRESLEVPNYFDVGIGYFVIHDANHAGQDARGLMASVKAYPLRQHYSEKRKDVVQQEVKDTVKDVAAKISQKEDAQQALVDAKAAEQAAIEKTKAAEAALIAANQKLSDKNGKDGKDKGSLVAVQQEVATATLKLAEAKSDETKAQNDVAAKDKEAKQAADASDEAKLADLVGKINNKNIYAVCTDSMAEYLLSRTYFFYGRSLGDAGNANVDGEINVVGLGYDFTPEFSLAAGYAVYDTDIAGIKDSKGALLLGVQLNLNAFSVFRGLGAK